MITRTVAAEAMSSPAAKALPMPRWQRQLTESVQDLDELLELLGLDAGSLGLDQSGFDPSARAVDDFALKVPRSFIARMRHGDPQDPLLRQVLPTTAELDATPGFGCDPVGDLAASPVPGVLHKYRGRALLVVTGACAVHCRYCFRRHFPYGEQHSRSWRAAIDYIAGEPSISEVILSGGDPLAVNDAKLADLAAGLAAIPHVRRLRIHTRLPVVLPSRIDDRLLDWLAPDDSRPNASTVRPIMVIHTNHANEIDAEVAAAMARLAEAKVTLLNQSVLLRGVNDSHESLLNLSFALFEIGVMPYYLHVLDRVSGAAHFAVDSQTARRLVWALMADLPGYLVPKLVREQAGAPAKLPICPTPSPG